MLCTHNPWLVLERCNLKYVQTSISVTPRVQQNNMKSAGEMNRRGKPLWEGNSCALEAAGIPLGSVQHPSPSERNQSAQGGQMGSVRQPGHVHCHRLDRQFLNRGEDNLYQDL